MTDGAAIQVVHLAERERFRAEVDVDGVPTEVGYLDYTSDVNNPDGGRLALTHTVIFDAYGGRGYAGELVGEVLDQIRSDGYQVVPVCSYVVKYIDKHPEYADLVATSR